MVDSLQSVDPYAKIIVMGDLNDNPVDRSVKIELRAKSDKSKLGLKDLYNPMELIYKQGIGSNANRAQWSLFDQILLSEPLLKDDYSSYRYYRAGIFNANFLITPIGLYKGYPFRSFDASGFTGGLATTSLPMSILLKRNFKTTKRPKVCGKATVPIPNHSQEQLFQI